MTAITNYYNVKVMNLPKFVFWRRLNTSQKISFSLFVSLLLLIPLATLASFSATVLRQRATEPITPPVIITPTPTPISTISPCIKTPQNFGVNGPCGDDLYRYSSFICQDGYKGEGGSTTSCKDINTWFQYAKGFCQQRGCLPTPPQFTPPPPTIVITKPPPLTPKPTLTTCQQIGGVCCNPKKCDRQKIWFGQPEYATQGSCNPSGILPRTGFCCTTCLP